MKLARMKQENKVDTFLEELSLLEHGSIKSRYDSGKKTLKIPHRKTLGGLKGKRRIRKQSRKQH